MRATHTFVLAALLLAAHHLHAQHLGVEYTAEMQTNFREINLVNFLRLNTEMPLGRSVSLVASTISIAKTCEDRLVNDLQVFSNIDEENLPLAIAVSGVNWQMADHHALFIGIRNVNEDFFTSPATSLFTNSSCGIYPTISANYPIANYPVASMGMHYKYENHSCDRAFSVQASLYNGIGYNRFAGRENVFRFCPIDDGIFGIAEVAYTCKGSQYFFGHALHGKDGLSYTPWAYAEQCVTNNITLLAGFSHAFMRESECQDFVGLGVCIRCGDTQIGVFSDYSTFGKQDEFATEITCKLPITEYMCIQPSAHVISHHSKPDYVVTLRMELKL